MTKKQKLIQQMLQMQKKFMEEQRQSGISQQQYYLPAEHSVLHGYHEEYEKMATQLVDLAHAEQKTSR